MSFHIQIYRQTTAHINLDHLAHNVRVLRNAVGESVFFCPMVKANAYGHGDVDVALRLQQEGITTLGVGLIEEALLLRQMGIKVEILVFGIFDLHGAIEIVRHKLTPVISQWSQVELLEKVLKVKANPMEVHIKFDTGMHRLGFDWLEANKIYDYFKGKTDLFKVKGLLTHLHSAEDAQNADGKSFDQLRKFLEVENVFASMKPIVHTLNSAGLLNFVAMRRGGNSGLPGISLNQGVRPGLAIYGYSPLDLPVTGVDLKPVMSLRSHVVAYHQLNVGEGVSYSYSWRAGRKSVIGIVPIGYADGFHRILSNKATVLFAGKRVPVVGNICMDHMAIDVTDIFTSQDKDFQSWSAQTEAEVTIFGFDSLGNLLPATELAQKSQTIAWEILTSIGERVPRITFEDHSKDFVSPRPEVKT